MQLRNLFRYVAESVFAPSAQLKRRYAAFKRLLDRDKRCLEHITELEEIQHGHVEADWARVASLLGALRWSARELTEALMEMNPLSHRGLAGRLDELDERLAGATDVASFASDPPYTASLAEAAGRPETCGGKAANLGAAAELPGVRVPEGFAVTAAAFSAFMEHNDLRHRIDELLSRAAPDDPEALDELCAHMQEAVEEAEIPQAVAAELAERFRELGADETASFAVRSSAVGEDAAGATFAGLYDSVLDVAPGNAAAALGEVWVSKYGPRSVAYRIRAGLADAATPMCALVVRMVEARVAGVAYTGERQGEEVLLTLYAVPGLADKLVEGEQEGVRYVFSQADGGLVPRQTPREGPLDEAEALEVALVCLRLEEEMGCPQDVEWCLDEGGPVIVQTRPLSLEAEEHCPPGLAGCPEIEAEPLVSGGERASGGVAVGRVHFPRGRTEAREIPTDAVVVCRTLSPKLVSLMGRLAAVVSPRGSRAGHFASVAREHGVPVIIGAENAFKALPEGGLVTVDADAGRVYRGEVEELRERIETRRRRPPTPLRERMDSFMDAVSPLSLTDPSAEDFAPSSVGSLHDLVRYCHEMGVREMFDLVGKGGRGMRGARPLVTDLPLEFRILDLGGGVDWEQVERAVYPEHLASRPMQAVWRGLTTPKEAWEGEGALAFVNEAVFDERMATTGGLIDATLASYAIVSEDYSHLMIRFGYHFAMVDALCGEDPERNYAGFRFKGGGASYSQRLLRLEYLRMVLERAGFEVTARGDLIDARMDRLPCAEIAEGLQILGIVLAETRALDMSMHDAAQATRMAEDFIATYIEGAARD